MIERLGFHLFVSKNIYDFIVALGVTTLSNSSHKERPALIANASSLIAQYPKLLGDFVGHFGVWDVNDCMFVSYVFIPPRSEFCCLFQHFAKTTVFALQIAAAENWTTLLVHKSWIGLYMIAKSMKIPIGWHHILSDCSEIRRENHLGWC